MALTLRVDNSRDWAEVVADDEVVYRGHVDEAQEYALLLLPVQWIEGEDVPGERVHKPVDIVKAEHHMQYWRSM